MRTARRLTLTVTAALAISSLWPALAQVIPGGPFSASGGGMPYPALLAPGVVGAPSLGWAAETNTGFYRAGAGDIRFALGGADQTRWLSTAMTLTAANTVSWGSSGVSGGDISIGRSGPGAIRVLGGTSPTQSGTTCGTGPTITGNNSLGSVTLGTTPGLPCTIVFNGSWGGTPRCFLNAEVLATGTTTVRATGVTTAQFVITSTAALVATDKVSWWCVSS